jgi:gliding motility-associated-like protein
MFVSGEFTATGNENYLTIGWFGDTISSDFYWFIPPEIDTTNGDSLYLTETYYLVDSLTLSELIFDIENFEINILTPNDDGKNDYLDFSIYNLKELSFTVFNRWGNKVFYSTDVNLKWNGKTNSGTPLSDGTYFYILNSTLSSGKKFNTHQTITILY